MSTNIASNLNKIQHTFDLNGRVGLTDYIDFLTPKEIPYNKVKGIDLYRRPFIILKVGIYDLKTTKFYKTGQVFFQRYSPSYLSHPYNFYSWQGASLDGEFLETSGGISPAQIKLIGDIVDNKLVKINEEHRGYKVKSHDDKVIASMDYWEDNAARVIQKNFLICRYNPKYAFCRKILHRQFDEYINSISE
jgi:hypothetical protein